MHSEKCFDQRNSTEMSKKSESFKLTDFEVNEIIYFLFCQRWFHKNLIKK